jgi:5'-nucleotidase
MELEVDFVLSGINAGGNLGADVYVSGTVAAVREAALLGRPGIALSHYKRRDLALDWVRAAGWVRALLPDLLSRPCPPGAFWNVNLPHLRPDEPDPEIFHCPLDSRPLAVAYRRVGDTFVYAGDYHSRPRDEGADVEACFGGRISVSLIRMG